MENSKMDRKIGVVVILVLGVVYQANAQVNCTATGAGRFTDGRDITCKNYTLCVFNSANSSYLSYNYVCPSTSVFNPASALCTSPASYVCNVTATNSTNTTSVCTADGFIANPSSTNCSSYIQCVQINNTFIQTTIDCPPDTFYNPNTTLCDSNYTCPANTTPAANTTTPFHCTTVGRYANTADRTCQSYFYCVLARNGTFLQYNYTCPTISVFSPTSKVCTTTYSCPTS